MLTVHNLVVGGTLVVDILVVGSLAVGILVVVLHILDLDCIRIHCYCYSLLLLLPSRLQNLTFLCQRNGLFTRFVFNALRPVS